MRSVNSGWRNDHTWCSSSKRSASSKLGCHGAWRSVALTRVASSRGASAARAASSTARSTQLGVGDALPGEADRGRARAVEPLAEQVHRGRGLRADGAVEQPGVAAAGVDADAQEPGVEARAACRRCGRRRRARG